MIPKHNWILATFGTTRIKTYPITHPIVVKHHQETREDIFVLSPIRSNNVACAEIIFSNPIEL